MCHHHTHNARGAAHTVLLWDQISVIVPTRNEAHNIASFLGSLHPDIELVLVDASDDETPVLVQHLRPHRTIVIRSTAHIAQARQLGADAARGRWLIFSDADVRFAPQYWEQLARLDLGAAFFGSKHATRAHHRYSLVFNMGQRLLHRVGIPAASGSNMGVRRDVLQQVGGFRIDLPVNEDTELMLRVRRRGFAVTYASGLGVYSIDDRRLDRSVARKLVHTLSRNLLLLINLYVPLPLRWLRHDWGYWSSADARGSGLRNISSQR